MTTHTVSPDVKIRVLQARLAKQEQLLRKLFIIYRTLGIHSLNPQYPAPGELFGGSMKGDPFAKISLDVKLSEEDYLAIKEILYGQRVE